MEMDYNVHTARVFTRRNASSQYQRVPPTPRNTDPKKSLEDKLNEDSPQPDTGVLCLSAAKIIMKVFYAARVARFDILRVVGFLTTRITKWTSKDDARLLRMMQYVRCTSDQAMTCWVGDPLDKINLHIYTDANHGKDGGTSTSGVQMNVEGPHTCFSVAALAVKQTSVSYSTSDAELVAANLGLRKVGLPGLIMWELLKGNAQSVTPVNTEGKSPKKDSATVATMSVKTARKRERIKEAERQAKERANRHFDDSSEPPLLIFHVDN